MFRFFIQLILFSIFMTFSSYSKNYEKIIINGNERISNETILVFSEIQDNIPLDENSINEILKKLYKSGFFKDVSVKIENDKLTINVLENPIIQTVFIEGIKKKKTEKEIYDLLTLKNRSAYNDTSVKNDQKFILSYLKNKGYYFSTISISTRDIGDNKIDLFYKINLGKKAKISKISFIGDKNFKDSLLRSIIVSEEYKFWKIISGKKYLNENIINLDKRLLTNFYKNKGFYDIIVDSTFANYLGNNKFELIYNISPGEKYFFNDLKINLPIDYSVNNFDELSSFFQELKGKNYSLTEIEKILKIIDEITLNKEFEFLESNVVEDVKDNLINLTFNIQESEKFYIEKINIFGNNITEESVIRNNLIIDEGDGFNELLHNRSINNIKSLNFFKSVNDEVVNGTLKNQKIININLEEKPTGEISAGAGVGSEGSTLAFGVIENNFLGKGIALNSNLRLTTTGVRGNFDLNNPNYKGSNRSLGISLESSVTDNLTDYGYKSNKTGFSIESGYEIFDNFFMNTGVSTYFETLKTDATASTNLKKQKGNYFDTFFNYTFDYDQRNQKFQTTNGYRSTFSQNIPLISESYSLKNRYDFTKYIEWLNENIITLSFFSASSNSLNGNNIKLSERLFLPSKKLRGFESGKIGPKDNSDFIGGNYSMAINASSTLPQVLPSLQNSDFIMFFDAGNIWGVDYDETIDDDNKIRSSVGIGVNINTVIGPLSFSLAQPITKGKNDITETFRFNLGTTF